MKFILFTHVAACMSLPPPYSTLHFKQMQLVWLLTTNTFTVCVYLHTKGGEKEREGESAGHSTHWTLHMHFKVKLRMHKYVYYIHRVWQPSRAANLLQLK